MILIVLAALALIALFTLMTIDSYKLATAPTGEAADKMGEIEGALSRPAPRAS
jgi:hypothetical protein